MSWLNHAKRFFDAAVNKPVREPRARGSSNRRTVWSFEALEPRLAMAAAGLVDVGAQPAGSLSGKIVYTSPGHGYQYAASAWRTGRSNSNDVVEDFGNQDQMTYYADYLFRAGATVVPMRPVGRQVNEVVLDNDSVGVTYSGSWADSTAGTRWYDEDYGAVADSIRYRFANTSATEAATATYTPNIPDAGFYPVYTWASAGTNRTSQLYEVNHTGGTTQVRVDHSQVGNGWVYLGTYHFDAGSSSTAGSVVISNQGVAGKVAIADAIRFGNGMGDLPMGSGGVGTGTISGKPREEEHSLLWVWRGIGQGVDPAAIFPTTAEDDSFVAPSIMAGRMNQGTAVGNSLFMGFHSNAFSDPAARGTVGLYHSSNPTPHQQSLATYTARQIDTDMKALGWDWGTRTYAVSGAFGEINNAFFDDEMDSIIIEVAFHTNPTDAAIMRDPMGRDQIARSTYEATLEYFFNWGTNPKPANVTLPSPPTTVHAVGNAAGEVTISWQAGASSANGYSGANGSPATSYRIYASTDGYGFDGGTLVTGGGTTSATLTGYDPTIPYYFKVVAENSGGESKASEVVTVLASGGSKQVLIVNGFDRNHESQNFRYEMRLVLPSGGLSTTDRVWSRYNNSFDYVVQTHAAIHAAAPEVHVASASNKAVISGAVNLADYDTVIWILGDESTADETFNSVEQAKVEQFIAGGGNVFLSGAEIGWDLDRAGESTAADRAFYQSTLLANYEDDDAGTYSATPHAGGIFAGLSTIAFSNGATFSSLDGQVYNVDFPDVISPQAGAQTALLYGNGTGAAIQAEGIGGRGSLVMLAFPFETITTTANRAAVMDRVFDFFGLNLPAPNADFNEDGTVDAADYTVWRDSLGGGVTPGALGDADYDGDVDTNDYALWKQQFGTSPGAGGSASLAASAAQPVAAIAPSPASKNVFTALFELGHDDRQFSRGQQPTRVISQVMDAARVDSELLLLLAESEVRGKVSAATADPATLNSDTDSSAEQELLAPLQLGPASHRWK